MQSVNDVIKRDFSGLISKSEELRQRIINSQEIQDFITSHEMTDVQIKQSMQSFREYLDSSMCKDGLYLPVLEYNQDYDCAIVSYRETEKIDEMKKQLKATYLEKYSVLGDESIKNASFDNFKRNTKEEDNAFKFALACARFYARDEQGNVIMYGQPGAGKSHLSMSILKQFNVKDKTALYISFSKMIRLIQNGWDEQKRGIQSEYNSEYALRLCSKADLLVLDDIGSEKISEWSDNLLCDILDNRQRTIITTNLTESKLRDAYNHRTFSRLYRNVGQHKFNFGQISDKRMNPV